MFHHSTTRHRERITVALFVLVLGSLSVKSYFWDLDRLRKTAEARAREVERLQAKDIKQSALILALQAEIKALKSDSEQTSVLARTTLGVVTSDEIVYQLHSQERND